MEFRAESRRDTICRASCCTAAKPNCLCPHCWMRHFAQVFLDAHGLRHGVFGEHHGDVVAMMAKYRAQR